MFKISLVNEKKCKAKHTNTKNENLAEISS